MKMLKTIVLIGILLSKVIYSTFWQINFRINQLEITALECENKNRPELKCNGKCYLAKQLQKADDELAAKKDKQQHSFPSLKISESTCFLSDATFEINFTKVILEKSPKTFVLYSNNYSFDYHQQFFHPPTFA